MEGKEKEGVCYGVEKRLRGGGRCSSRVVVKDMSRQLWWRVATTTLTAMLESPNPGERSIGIRLAGRVLGGDVANGPSDAGAERWPLPSHR